MFMVAALAAVAVFIAVVAAALVAASAANAVAAGKAAPPEGHCTAVSVAVSDDAEAAEDGTARAPMPSPTSATGGGSPGAKCRRVPGACEAERADERAAPETPPRAKDAADKFVPEVEGQERLLLESMGWREEDYADIEPLTDEEIDEARRMWAARRPAGFVPAAGGGTAAKLA